MRLGHVLVLLGLCWIAAFAPAANVGFESIMIQLTVLETLPAVAALLFVTTALLGLAAYLRTAVLPAVVAALASFGQWLPLLVLSPASPALLVKYAEMSGVDLSSADNPPDTIQVLSTSWFLAASSIALGVALTVLAVMRGLNRNVKSPTARRQRAAMKSDDDLWSTQLLESRGRQKE